MSKVSLGGWLWLIAGQEGVCGWRDSILRDGSKICLER